jgi:hypothetical protein
VQSKESPDDRRRDLAADIAHAVRGPFSAAMPALGMLLDGVLGELDPRQRDALLTIDRAIQRAFADSCDLVTLISGELAHAQLRPAPCTAGDLLACAVVLAGSDHAEHVGFEIAPDLSPAFVDRERTALALALLIGCCVPSAGPGGSLHLCAGRGRCPALDTKSRPDVVEIRIHACGESGLKPGGAAADYPLESAGLLACRAIVEAQHGRLDVSGNGRPATRSQEPGSQDASETAAAIVWLPAAPAWREGDRA